MATTFQDELQAQLGVGRGRPMPQQGWRPTNTGSGLVGAPTLQPPTPAPGQIMHGNQPGVPQATGNTMSVTMDPSKVGGERFTTTSQPPGGTMKILDRSPAERAQGVAAFEAAFGRAPGASDFHKWEDPFPGVPESGGPRGNIADALGGGGGDRRSLLEGFDSTKLGNLDHTSPKYQIGRVLRDFDPKAGVTPELLAALNALGIGTFEGSGDKVRVSGAVDPRFEGFTTIDLVRGFNGPGGGQAWQYGAENPNAPGAAAAANGAAMGGGGAGYDPSMGLAALLSGNPLQRIQQAIWSINGQGQVNLEALLAQLGVGNG